MTLRIPGYIENARIIDQSPRYKWNDVDPMSICGHGESKFSREVGKISRRGLAALSAGFAEWVAWRLKNYCDDRVLFLKIEAMWLAVVDWRYMHLPDAPERKVFKKDWQGADRGPVYVAFKLLDEVFDSVSREQASSPYVGCLAQLVLHIIGKPKPFSDWYRLIVARFAKLYPATRKDMVGPPVPREALDPELDFKAAMTNELLAEFLGSLDYKNNRFLRSPKEMIEEGFEGTPYRL
jgi:hypothetical protein